MTQSLSAEAAAAARAVHDLHAEAVARGDAPASITTAVDMAALTRLAAERTNTQPQEGNPL